MKLFSKICLSLVLSASTLMAVEAPKIRGGHIMMSYKETQRKLRWVEADGSYNYLQPKPGKKFINLVVKLEKGFSISTADYSLNAQGLGFKAMSLVELKKGKESYYGSKNTEGTAKSKASVFKILFEVPRDIDKFDIVFNLESTIPQKTIKQQSFTFSDKEIFKISDKNK